MSVDDKRPTKAHRLSPQQTPCHPEAEPDQLSPINRAKFTIKKTTDVFNRDKIITIHGL